MNLKQMLNLIEVFPQEQHYVMMRDCVEDSECHREANVLVHTRMVCKWYRENVSANADWFALGYIACMLHDIAKPMCRTPKFNKERGHYFGYDKHDIVGAQYATSFLVKHGIHEFDVVRIAWMIDHHQVIWSVKNKELSDRIVRELNVLSIYQPFKMFMMADTYGRITEKPFNAHAFFEEFERKHYENLRLS